MNFSLFERNKNLNYQGKCRGKKGADTTEKK